MCSAVVTMDDHERANNNQSCMCMYCMDDRASLNGKKLHST